MEDTPDVKINVAVLEDYINLLFRFKYKLERICNVYLFSSTRDLIECVKKIPIHLFVIDNRITEERDYDVYNAGLSCIYIIDQLVRTRAPILLYTGWPLPDSGCLKDFVYSRIGESNIIKKRGEDDVDQIISKIIAHSNIINTKLSSKVIYIYATVPNRHIYFSPGQPITLSIYISHEPLSISQTSLLGFVKMDNFCYDYINLDLIGSNVVNTSPHSCFTYLSTDSPAKHNLTFEVIKPPHDLKTSVTLLIFTRLKYIGRVSFNVLIR